MSIICHFSTARESYLVRIFCAPSRCPQLTIANKVSSSTFPNGVEGKTCSGKKPSHSRAYLASRRQTTIQVVFYVLYESRCKYVSKWSVSYRAQVRGEGLVNNSPQMSASGSDCWVNLMPTSSLITCLNVVDFAPTPSFFRPSVITPPSQYVDKSPENSVLSPHCVPGWVRRVWTNVWFNHNVS